MCRTILSFCLFTGQEFICIGLSVGCCRSGSDVFGVCWSEGPLERVLDGLHKGCCCYVGVGWPRHENTALSGECLYALAEAG